ncbi:GNAT family N-acetyltransferase [Candidatus Palauibacter soopunensis]|uniref:GNAT family N-acetyltransferase n=1 Tax=Candidatus Palauibacter soopunensis TaxID=3056739 RepID=UPI00239AE4CB|nr:GNAT family N-acetyltransferase [Candidatus Palauibacter soopunensis]MDE2877790.1 GNAT family N-acetyltransferase [Candidatus Palauibacter soopunensis]
METREFEIRTERLLLRPHRLEDVDDIFEFARDPEWARYLPVPVPYLREHAEEFVAQRILTSREEWPVWAIVLAGKVIGGIGIRIDVEHATGALGYSIAKEHWGRGLTVEAARAVVDWAFRERGLAKVYAYADVRNTSSLRVMEKLGMTREGMLRGHRTLREERVDDVYYGLLREEWGRDEG